MTDRLEFIDVIGRLAQESGWTVTAVKAADDDGVAIMFRPNRSPYGVLSSRERAKSRVAVLSHIAGEQVRRWRTGSDATRPQQLNIQPSPDCRQNKHQACTGDTWDETRDALTGCPCDCNR